MLFLITIITLKLEYYFTNQYNTVGTTEINACGDNASTLRETLMQVMSLNQEAPPPLGGCSSYNV